jgi:DNA-binding response OmpR family regulator
VQHLCTGYPSAEQLLEQAWDENADPFTKTVQVTMSRLRRKLGDPNIICTILSIGYRIAATAQANTVTPHQA